MAYSDALGDFLDAYSIFLPVLREARPSAQIDRVALQHLEGDDLQGRLVGCRQPDLGCLAGLERLFPALRAEAPAVARLEAGEAEFGHRGREIVAGRARERQEVGIDFCAHSVQPQIFGPGVAAAVAIKSGHWLGAAFGGRFAEDVAGITHGQGSLGFELTPAGAPPVRPAELRWHPRSWVRSRCRRAARSPGCRSAR